MRSSYDGFERRSCIDEYGRKITYYAHEEATTDRRRLVTYVQGSGCHSVFVAGRDGAHARQPGILAKIAISRADVLVVEKPGVRFLDDPGASGTAQHCRRGFLVEHTLERWSAAIAAVLKAQTRARRYASVALVGQSEGGIVAAAVARRVPKVTHVALLSSSGPTQVFDLLCAPRPESEIRAALERIARSPQSVSRFEWGHPHRRWSSFLATSALGELLGSTAAVMIVHGRRDTVVPIAAARVTQAELLARGRSVRFVELDAAHDLRPARRSHAKSLEYVFGEVLHWLCDDADA